MRLFAFRMLHSSILHFQEQIRDGKPSMESLEALGVDVTSAVRVYISPTLITLDKAEDVWITKARKNLLEPEQHQNNIYAGNKKHAPREAYYATKRSSEVRSFPTMNQYLNHITLHSWWVLDPARIARFIRSKHLNNLLGDCKGHQKIMA